MVDESLESLLEDTTTTEVIAESDKTTIPCKKTTRIRIKDFGKKGESYDHLLNRMSDIVEKFEKGDIIPKVN